MLRFLLRFCFVWSLAEAIYNLPLGHDSNFYWDLNYKKQELTVEVHTHNFEPSKSWVGVGFSNYGSFKDGSGDFCIVWNSIISSNNNQKENFEISDVHITNDSIIAVDQTQNCKDFKFFYKNRTLKWSFKREFTTCDLDDYALEEGTTHLHWMKGNGPIFSINGVSIEDIKEKGFLRTRLLKNLKPDPKLDPVTTSTFDVITTAVKIPAIETLYFCAIVKIPENIQIKKHQIVQFAVNVQRGNEELVHHMEVFHCEAEPEREIPLYAGPCDDSPPEIKSCNHVMAAWAMGAEPLHYPAEVGYPIGGSDFNPYVRLEIHYNNPLKKADWVDSSGMKFWVTDELREFDAGVIELGLEYTDKNSIPPRSSGFTLTGVCNTECTSVGIPPEGILVFASQLHTHLTGTRVITRHFRKRAALDLLSFSKTGASKKMEKFPDEELEGFIEMPTFNWDNHYSTHFQEIRLLKKPIRLLPGDVLLTSCEFSTLDRVNMTLGGFSISDEMCVNYIHYYPRINLEVCKSSVSYEALHNYFTLMKEMDGQSKLEPLGIISSNYNKIQWTQLRENFLENYYNKSPIDMQCNQSDGRRFPGSWHNMPQIQFPPLEPKQNPNECLGEDDILTSEEKNIIEKEIKYAKI